MEGLIFGGAYVRREICVSKSIGLACSGKKIYHFCFVLLCIRGQIPITSPRGAYIRRGDLTEGFLRYDSGGFIFGGAYTWRGLFSEFYGNSNMHSSAHPILLSLHSPPTPFQIFQKLFFPISPGCYSHLTEIEGNGFAKCWS